MFLAGAKNLEAKKEWINELNVFPVPDGDTGTNMTMTIMAAAAEVGSLGETDMETLAKAISSGSLRGARGNSGVILSQLLRGFTKSVRKSENLDAAAIRCALSDNADAAALTAAAHTMYDRVFHNRLQCEFRQFTGRTAAVAVHLERNTFTEPQLLQ